MAEENAVPYPAMDDHIQDPEDSESSHQGIGDVVLGLVLALLPGLLYFGAAHLLGIWDDPAASRARIAGVVITYVLFGVVMIVGESVIEDIVKFLFFSLACAVLWGGRGEQVRAFLLAIPIGSGLPLLTRMIAHGIGRKGTA